MINNDIGSQLSRYFGNRASGQTGGVNDIYKRLKEKHDAINGRGKTGGDEAAEAGKATEEAATANRVGRGVLHKKTDKEQEKTDSQAQAQTKTEDEELSPAERRQKEIKAILDKLNAEEAARYPNRASSKETESTVVSPESDAEKSSSGGLAGFLNDMPLFNEFKAGLMDAFSRLHSAAVGSISAQYELNYSSMQYIANEAGGFDYKETSFSVKLDLNYIKAASGGQTGKEISDLIAGSNDFESLINNLKNASQTQQASQATPQDFLSSLQDYFSPEKTAGRIVDFATAFFPASDQFKANGDTPDAREEFAEIMRKAIQKGFDQAMGVLGKVPRQTQDDIDKTHELVFKGIDDFVKNGLNKDKQDNGVYSALEQFVFSSEISYSEKYVSVRTGSTYDRNGAATNNPTQSALDTQA